MLAILLGCGLRRSEPAALNMNEIQTREGHWAIIGLIGKGGHIRTVPVPQCVKHALDVWTATAGVTEERIFRRQSDSKGMGGRYLAE